MPPHLFQADDPVTALHELLEHLVTSGARVNDKYEEVQCLVAIDSDATFSVLEELRPVHEQLAGSESWERATQLYQSTRALSWKASYRGRLVGAAKEDEEDQVERVAQRLARLPGSNTLTLTFIRPNDHRRAEVIPAGVPCPLTVDFKFRGESLHMAVFFRSQDVFRFGLPDLYYFRHFQQEVLTRARECDPPKRLAEGRLGRLCFFLSRGYVRSKDRSSALEFCAAAHNLQTVSVDGG